MVFTGNREWGMGEKVSIRLRSNPVSPVHEARSLRPQGRTRFPAAAHPRSGGRGYGGPYRLFREQANVRVHSRPGRGNTVAGRDRQGAPVLEEGRFFVPAQ